ncbi:MAG: hypothetical protein IRZ07_04125 [Microbispora sp.]|nr:hypothetical protein [Microbispora sp.]
MRKRTLAAVVAAGAVLGVGGAGYAAVASASSQPAVLGACANTKAKGALRLLEPGNLNKSQWGKCGKGEVKIQVATSVAKGPKGDPGPQGPKGDPGPAPNVFVFRRASGVETCRKAATSTPDRLVYVCTTRPTPSPSATPSASPTPSSS